MALMESIRANDSSMKELYLTDKPNTYFRTVATFLTALKSNATLECIYLGGDFLSGLLKRDIHAILDTVGKLTSLKEVFLWSSSIQITSLISLVSHATGLEVLELGSVTLTGNSDDFETFSNALSKLPSLRELSLLDFKFGASAGFARLPSFRDLAQKEPKPESSEIQLSALLKALPSIKKLSAIRLAPSNAKDMPLSSSALMKVLEMPTLRELHLSRFRLGKPHIGVISWAIGRSGGLKVLALPDTGFEDIAANRLSASLEQSSLEMLDLSNNNELTNEGVSLIAKCLLGNRHLKVLSLDGCKSIGTKGLAALAQIVANETTTLKHVQTPSVMESERRGLADGAPSQSTNVRAKAA